MSHVSSHPDGSFCWPELATSNQDAAKEFYGDLFGWTPKDQPIGPDGVYSLMQIGGSDVAAIYAQGAQEQGIPPHWNSYIAVASADDSAKKAADLGGTVMMAPFDVFDSGRMAVIQDPTGAVFCLWQANKHVGVTRINEPGTLCWTELVTNDTKKAGPFYEQLFGWRLKVGTAAPGEYTEFYLGDRAIGGMMPIQKEWGPVPPHWTPYFLVADVDATTKLASERGGNAMMPPTDIPTVGRFSVIQDPQGAVFNLFKPAMQQA